MTKVDDYYYRLLSSRGRRKEKHMRDRQSMGLDIDEVNPTAGEGWDEAASDEGSCRCETQLRGRRSLVVRALN